MRRKKIVVVGAGGQARDTSWLIRCLNEVSDDYEFLGYVVTDLGSLGEHDSPVLGDYRWLQSNDFDALALGIGSPRARLKVANELSTMFPEAEWPTLVHPSAIFDRVSCHLGRGVMVAAGVCGSVNIRLEDFALVNIGVTLGHEAHLGRGVVVNHGASISGGVVIEEQVLVGSRSCVLQYLSVQRGATVGAGAVVTRDVVSMTTVVGVPAREIGV